MSKSELYLLYDDIKEKKFIGYELAERTEVKILRLLVNAGISKRFLSADIQSVPESLRKATEGFVIGKGYYIYGEIGSGKTYLLSALINDRILKSYEKYSDLQILPKFESVPSILLAVKNCFKDRSETSEEDIIYRYSQYSCLVLDDLGTEKLSEWVLQTLYSIVDNRYRDEKQTVFTSNLDLNQIKDRIGDRIPSRIAEMCQIVHIKGRDRRLKAK